MLRVCDGAVYRRLGRLFVLARLEDIQEIGFHLREQKVSLCIVGILRGSLLELGLQGLQLRFIPSTPRSLERRGQWIIGGFDRSAAYLG